MLDDSQLSVFNKIYSTDLLYSQDCWKLCGDAHCCSFSRYKAKFALIGRIKSQELPLLPGEYEYLEKRGWLDQFGTFEHKVIDYTLDHRTLRVESIISHKPHCACNHDTRPIVCRLYPLLPIFDIDGRVTGTDIFGIYEELEKMDHLEPACKLTEISFNELQKFLTISSAIGQSPEMLYYITAYRITLKHIALSLSKSGNDKNGSSFGLFEKALIRNQLINQSELKVQLISLADDFETRYGIQFQLCKAL